MPAMEEVKLKINPLVSGQHDVMYCPLNLLSKSPLPIVKIDRQVIKLSSGFGL
jgi:hypothetical protein